MNPRVFAAIALAFLVPTIGLSQGPIRNWLRGDRAVTRSYSSSPTGGYFTYSNESSHPVYNEPPKVMYCVGPDCQHAKTAWAQQTVTPAPPIVVQRAPETVLQRSAPVVTPKQTASTFGEELSEAEIESGTKFSRSLVKAAIKAQREGKLKRTDVLRLRVAMLSPAFRQQAEELCMIQIAASGEDSPFEYADDGTIIRTAIDWEGLAAFLERVVPLILTLLKAFGLS
jgi:hypothetical protein